jgi:hypothetical protein|uniref:Uncharacterized protein n=1 Tax=Desulfobacca acetoxidans TaxID=60893 RepID=A0A7V6A3D1_9BACT
MAVQAIYISKEEATMGGCSCSCKGPAKPANTEENKTYVCTQCNTFKSAKAGEPAPECCGKKMNEMD